MLPIHIRTDANNLVTTAGTTHLPEQKETHHLIQMLRHESNSGSLHDLGHVASEYCLADPLTKHSAKPDQLLKTIETGISECCDVHPPFRTLIKHKAFLVDWMVHFLKNPHRITHVLGEPVGEEIFLMFNGTNLQMSCYRLRMLFYIFLSAFCIWLMQLPLAFVGRPSTSSISSARTFEMKRSGSMNIFVQEPKAKGSRTTGSMSVYAPTPKAKGSRTSGQPTTQTHVEDHRRANRGILWRRLNDEITNLDANEARHNVECFGINASKRLAGLIRHEEKVDRNPDVSVNMEDVTQWTNKHLGTTRDGFFCRSHFHGRRRAELEYHHGDGAPR